MQSARQQLQHNQRGGRPQYRYQRWTPPPEPKPEPKLDLSDKSFPSLPLSNAPQTQSTGGYDFATKFSTTVKVMSELEKLQELRELREREQTRQERDAMKGVYTGRFQGGRLATTRLEEPEEHRWVPPPTQREPAEDEWVEVRHSKARKSAHVKTVEELEEDYEDKAADEAAADEYNGDLFERSHRHDHYAT
jgi:hypothetical protein